MARFAMTMDGGDNGNGFTRDCDNNIVFTPPLLRVRCFIVLFFLFSLFVAKKSTSYFQFYFMLYFFTLWNNIWCVLLAMKSKIMNRNTKFLAAQMGIV